MLARLLTHAEAHFRQRNCKRISLDTTAPLTRAIRFYEGEGLLTPSRAGRRRIYNNRDRVRLKLILRGKRLGFALSEIKELLDLYDTSHSEEPQLKEFLQRLDARRASLRSRAPRCRCAIAASCRWHAHFASAAVAVRS